MRITLSVLEPATRRCLDVLVEVASGASAGELVDLAAGVLGRGAGAVAFVDGRPVDRAAPAVVSGLREGCVLSLDVPARWPRRRDADVVLVRASGAGAGDRWPLSAGEHAGAALDPELAGCTIEVSADGTVHVRSEASHLLDGTPPGTSGAPWPPEALLHGPASLWTVRPPAVEAAALSPTDEATVEVTRPPRLTQPPVAVTLTRPATPTPPASRPFPLLVAFLPLVASGLFAWVAHSPQFLLLGLLTPVALLGSAWSDRRGDRRRTRAAAAEHILALADLQQRTRSLLATEADDRRREAPDPAAVRQIALTPGRRLWERDPDDPDALHLRLGTARLPARLTVEDPDLPQRERLLHLPLADVPVVLPLREAGVLGLAAPDGSAHRLAGWLVAQAATLHPPEALQTVVLCESAAAGAWTWARWLPHVRPRLGQHAEVLVAGGAEAVAARVGELVALVERRAATREPDVGRRPEVLVVVDGARRLRALPGLAAVLRDGPAHGVYAICVESEERLLPQECQAVLVVDQTGTAVLHRAGQGPLHAIRADDVRPGLAEEVARALAPLRDATPARSDAALPPTARLLEVMDLDLPDVGAVAERIAQRWRASGGRSADAVLGISVDGPMVVDLTRDGPHALVAGTTGSGKSELLQTFVAALALANRPDALSFVLVDYKGGAAFRECAGLPHTVGLVTDLDGALVQRALASLRAEIGRRERLLAAAEASDIEDHSRVVARGGAPGPPLGRLVIVVDEFAALSRELPDFVAGLVDIAQRGRSLGVSLVLATQRPSGSVSAEIRANASLRIALRMSDAGESSDVVDAPDAARIERHLPGRAVARLAAGSLLPFQAARVGGPRPGAGPATSYALEVPLALAVRPVGRPGGGHGSLDAETDLAHIVAALREATRLESVTVPASPWLPPLPARLSMGSLTGRDVDAPGYALADLPDLQSQLVLRAGPEAPLDHLLVAGAAGSGRSSALRAYAVSLLLSHPPEDLHVYAIDCGSGGLRGLEAFPHVGAVVGRSESGRALRLLTRLVEQLTERLAAPDRCARTVLLLDGWEGFLSAWVAEADGDRLLDALLLLAREGASAGISLVVAGDRSLLTGRLAASVGTRILLRLADPADYALAGVSPRSLPAAGLVPGQGFALGLPGLVAADGPQGTAAVPRLVQFALLDTTAPREQTQQAALAGLGAAASSRHPRARHARSPDLVVPFRVDALPAVIDRAAALRLPRGPTPSSGTWALVGVGGDELSALGPDLSAGSGCFLVAGPPRSGRSTALGMIAHALLEQGVPLVVLAPRASPLTALEGTGPVRVFAGPDPDQAAVAAAVRELRAGGPAPVVLVDDGEELRTAGIAPLLGELVRAAGQDGGAVVVAGEAESVCAGFSGWQVEVRRSRRGLLLSPQSPVDGDLIGVRLPRAAVGTLVRPGVGLLHLGDGRLLTVRIPLL